MACAAWEKQRQLIVHAGCVEIVVRNSNKYLRLWTTLMKIGEYSGCHQMYERSFVYKGYQFPVCARCTGIFIGQIIGLIMIILGLRVKSSVSVLLIMPMALDGIIQLVKIKESNNIRRVITGFIAGIGYITLLFNIIIFLKHLVC